MNEYVICVSNSGTEVSLTIGKVYRTLPDEAAKPDGLIRVIDDTYGEAGSEDGYLYPQSMFAPIEVPAAAEAVLAG